MNAAASTNYQPKGVWEGRAAHVIAKAKPSLAGADEVIVRSAESLSASEVTILDADLWIRKDDWLRSVKEIGGTK